VGTNWQGMAHGLAGLIWRWDC